MQKSHVFVDRVILKDDIPKNSYLKSVPAVRHLEKTGRIDFKSSVTIIIGENGTGKSTLIEAIALACGFNPEGGTKNYCFSTNDTHSPLHNCIKVSRLGREKDGYFLRAESFYNASSYLEELDSIDCSAPPVLLSYGGKSLHKRSHGEAFLALVLNRFGGKGLYILDEPEAALSPMRLLVLMKRMAELADMDSQFIISTHSPMLMAYPGAQVLEISEDGIEEIDYRQSEHFALMKRFLSDPKSVLSGVLGEN